MKRMNTIQISLMTIATIFLFTLSLAAGTSRTLDFEVMAKHSEASGTALIDNEHLSIQARGLEPDAIYTVWFVNMKPKKNEAGAGTPPYKFQTDKWGNGSYSAALNESPFDKWAMVMVVLHPDGDPKNMKNMVGALKAKL